MKFLQSRASTRMSSPQLFDEWFIHWFRGVDDSIYSPYTYTGVDASPPTADLINLESGATVHETGQDPRAVVSEVFLFEYGVTVIWGMTEAEEKRFLNEICKFEVESLRISPYGKEKTLKN